MTFLHSTLINFVAIYAESESVLSAHLRLFPLFSQERENYICERVDSDSRSVFPAAKIDKQIARSATIYMCTVQPVINND